jgi:hypothetical protein
MAWSDQFWKPIKLKDGRMLRTLGCKYAFKRGSDAYLMNHRSLEADYACLEQVELSSPIHLPLDELELAYVAFGLAVGP